MQIDKNRTLRTRINVSPHYKRLQKCLIRKLEQNPLSFLRCLKSWRYGPLLNGYEKEQLEAKDLMYKPTKIIVMGDEWVKMRNNIIISYCPPYNGDYAVKTYFMIKDNFVVMLRQKFIY